MSEGLRKSPYKSKNEVFAICHEMTSASLLLGGRKNIVSYFFVLTLTCRHSQKLKLTPIMGREVGFVLLFGGYCEVFYNSGP